MTSYYPSQAGYAVSQPVMPMAQPYGMPGSYAPTGGMIAPTMVSALPATVAAPVVMQPSYHGGYGHAYGNGYGYGYGGAHYNPYSWANRFRRFLGLPPGANVRYKSDRSTWGFMGYSRRQRYIDALSGGEVTRDGQHRVIRA